jgi:hypothetical protein
MLAGALSEFGAAGGGGGGVGALAKLICNN